MTTTGHGAAAFAASEAIRAGAFDLHLGAIMQSIRERRRLLDRGQPPLRTQEMCETAQVWVWMNREDGGVWEIRGTGAIRATTSAQRTSDTTPGTSDTTQGKDEL